MATVRYVPSVRRVTGRKGAAIATDTIADVLHRLADSPPERVLSVPALGTATEDDVIRGLEGPESRLLELIDGVLVEKPRGAREELIGSWVSRMIWNFVDENDLGIVLGENVPTRFRLRLIRLPDVAFVAWKRIRNEEFPDDKVSKIIPNLAVEVLSESNTKREIELKLDEYFTAGVQVAWIIDPKTRTAKVYTSRSRHQDIGLTGVLEARKALPGFRLPLADVFSSVRRKKRKPK